MDTLLRIDASVRSEGSYSRALADHVQARWLATHPGGRVIVRDLARTPPPHLDATTVAAFCGHGTQPVPCSDAFIAELREATDLLVATPLYNFGIPSTLKAWIDHVVRSGTTFAYRDGRYEPLLRGRRAYLAIARGSVPGGPDTEEHLLPHLHKVLRFIGWPFVDVVQVTGTSAPDLVPEEHLAAAFAAVDALWDPGPLRVDGIPSPEDRAAIDELRAAQADAILRGDAAAYARLCTEDICLLLPGYPLALGRAAFLARERALLASGRVRRFEKTPVRLTFEGPLAIEVGVQRTEVVDATATGAFCHTQKYTHVFRRSTEGWRYAVLMSNPSE